MDNAIYFPNTYPLDSDLFGGWRNPTFEQVTVALKLRFLIILCGRFMSVNNFWLHKRTQGSGSDRLFRKLLRHFK